MIGKNLPVTHAAGALAAGAIYPLAFAPISWVPLVVVSLGALYWLTNRAQPGRAALIGWLYGCGMLGVGVSWIQISVHQFGLPVYVFSVTVTVLFVIGLALLTAGAGLLTSLLHVARPSVSLLVFASTWTLHEWIRGWLFTGFPWLHAGYSQTDTWLGGFAPLGGVLLVSFAVALCAAIAVQGLTTDSGRRVRAAMVAALAAVVLAGGGSSAISYTDAAGPPIRAALVQGNIAQSLKWSAAERERTLNLYRTLTDNHWDADLVVWPETAVPAFPREVRGYLQDLRDTATATDTTLLIGMPTIFGDDRLLNSVVAIGAQPGQYDKRHLVPFGEYLPMRSLLGPLLERLSIRMADLSTGLEFQAPILVNGLEVGISICYEDAFAEEVGKALPTAALFVNVSNDAWFGDSLAPHQHMQIARMRAIEFQRPLLRATNTGISAALDERGRIIAQIPQFESGSVSVSVTPHLGATPFARLRNTPVLTLLTLCLAAAAVLRIDALRRRTRGSAGGA